MAKNRSRTGADEPKFWPKFGKNGQKFVPKFFILLYKTYLAIVSKKKKHFKFKEPKNTVSKTEKKFKPIHIDLYYCL